MSPERDGHSRLVTEPLPEFPYHPDPVATGSVVRSAGSCLSCGRARGFIYIGPVFAVEDLQDSLCPWCIADGSAARRFNASFTDDHPLPEGVPAEVVETVTTRTPGFSGWQQEHWLYHCGDGCVFLGAVGWREVEGRPGAIEALRHEIADYGWSATKAEEYLRSLSGDGSPTAYLFECRRCGIALAYSDFD